MAWVVRVLGSTTHISWQHSHKLQDFLVKLVRFKSRFVGFTLGGGWI